MKRVFLGLIIMVIVCSLAACGNNNKQNVSSDSDSQAEGSGRISLDESSSATYKEHVADLWEQSKTLFRDDLSANYSDEKYQELGKEIDIAWTNLQVHTSINHKDEVDAADEDVSYANLTGHIKDLIDREYGNWDIGTPEERAEKRESLRDSGLEDKITELDKVVYATE